MPPVVPKRSDPLAPEGWAEVDRSEELTPPKKHPLTPKQGQWQEVRRNPADNQYVPQSLRGTKHEGAVDDITKVLFTEGAKGFDTAVRVDQGNLQWALQAFKGLSPDEAAKVQEIAKRGGEAFPAVYQNKEEWKRWDEARQVYDTLTAKDEKGEYQYPGTIQWLADPEKMAVAKDDLEALTMIEGLIVKHQRPWIVQAGVTLREESQRAVQNLLTAAASTIEYFDEGMDATQGTLAGSLMNVLPLRPLLLQQLGADERGVEAVKKLVRSEFLDYNPLPRDEALTLEQFTLDAVGIVPQIAGALGTAVATGSPFGSAAFMFPYIYGGTYNDLTEAGVDRDRAAIASMVNAGAQSALEAVGFNKLFQFFNAVGSRGAGVVFRKYAEALGTEWLTEFLQAFPEDATRIWAQAQQQGLDVPQQLELFWTNLDQTMQQGAYEGLITTFVSALSGAGAIPSMIRHAGALDQDIAFWERLEQAAQQSKLKGRSPDEFEEYAQQTLERSDAPQSVFVSYDAVAKFFQDDEQQIRKFAQDMGIEDQMTDARTTGRDLEIKTSKWQAQLSGTDLSLALRGDIRFTVDGMTANERAALDQEIRKKLDEMQLEYDRLVDQNELPEQVTKIRDQLIAPKKDGGFGLKAEDADAQIAVFLAGAEQLSRQTGESLNEWFARVNPVLQVGGEFVASDTTLTQSAPDVTQSEAFQAFFQDSVVRDESGAPRVVYHGSGAAIEEFDFAFTDQGADALGSGFYFTTDEREGRGYMTARNSSGSEKPGGEAAPTLVRAYLNLSNPLDADAVGSVTPAQIAKILKRAPGYEDALTNYGDVDFEGRAAVVARAVEAYAFEDDNILERLHPIANDFFSGEVEAFNNAIRDVLGYDGVKKDFDDRTHYVAFFPEQIKSVDNQGTFDPQSRNIFLQQDNPVSSLFDLVESGDKLVAMHNLDAESLYFADGIGGLAVPSLAITSSGAPLTGFGDISLIAAPTLVDPRASAKNKVFDTDIYSPRYPEVQYVVDRRKLERSEYKDVLAEVEKKYSGTLLPDWQSVSIYALADMIESEARRLDSQTLLRLMFAESQGHTVADRAEVDAYSDESFIRANAEAYEKYVQDLKKAVVKSERIFVGTTPQGARKYRAHTLENVVRLMKQELQGGEGFNYGAGSVRAVVSNQFRSIKQIQGDRDRLVDATTMDAVKDEINAELSELIEKMSKYIKHSTGNSFIDMDAVTEHLKESARRPMADIAQDYYNGLPFELQKAAVDFMIKIQNAPSEYFEAKVQRAVALSEFTAALIPDTAPARVEQVLRLNGIDKIVRYSKSQGHDRDTVMTELAAQAPEVFFQNPAQPRGSVEFTQGQALISLYKSANLSTFLHETAHIFATEIRKMAQAGQGDTQFQKDYDALIEAFGDLATVEGQEAFARSFEAYLRNGKAPSVKLVEAFRKFRAWLTAIYRSLRGLGTDITPEISGVFDRLLASQEDISEVQEYYHFKQSLISLLPVDAKKKVQADERREKTQAEALEAQISRYMRAYLSAIGGRAAIRDFASREYEDKPAVRAVARAKEAGGLDGDEIELRYGPQALEQIRKKFPGLIARKRAAAKETSYYALVLQYGGIDPDSMGAQERKVFKENGLFGLFRKGGRGLDDVAQSLINDGHMFADSDANPSDQLRALLEGRAVRPEDNFVEPNKSIGELAVELEYASPDVLFEELAQLPGKQEFVNARTEELVREREQEIRQELSAGETVPGDEAYHTESHLSYLIAEAELLADAIEKARGSRSRRLEERIIRDAARDIILSKRASIATRYDLYAKAERKYAKLALDLTEAGDYAGAFEAKKKQILNHALVQAAIKARDQKIAIEGRYKPSKINSALKSVENDYAEIALDLIQSYKLAEVGPQRPGDLANLTDLDDNLAHQIPEWILQRRRPDGFENYRDLTMQELIELDEAVRTIMHAGRDTLGVLQDEQIKTVEDLANASVAQMDKLQDRQVFNEFSTKGKFLNKLDGLLSQSVMAEFLFDRLDGYLFSTDKVFGPLRRAFNKAIAAEAKYDTLRRQTYEAAKEHWGVLFKAKRRLEKLHGGRDFDIEGVPVTQAMRDLGRDRWTPERVIAFVLNMGNDGNTSALANSYGYNAVQMHRVASQLTAEELRAIQGVWDVTDTLFPELDEVNFRIYNRHLEKVDAREVVFESTEGEEVTLKGGYYPLVFDHQLSDRAGAFKEAQDDILKNRQTAVFRSTKPKDGVTYSRRPGHSIPPQLSLSVWFNHISDTSRYISHAEVLRDLNRLSKNEAWKEAVRKKAGRAAYDNIRRWLTYQARPERYVQGDWDRFIDWQRRLATVAILGLNVGVAAKQRLSMFSAAQDIGWGSILEAYKQLDLQGSVLGLQGSEMWDRVTAQSAYMRARQGSIDRELHDALDRFNPNIRRINIAGKEFTAKDVQQFAFEWIQMNDRATVGVVWTAAFNKAMKDKAQDAAMTDEQRAAFATEYADSIVRTTQPSALPADLNDLQRAEGMVRLFTSFMTWSFKAGNRFIAKGKAYRDGNISTAEFTRHVLYEYFMASWGAAIISSLLIDGDLPEPAEFLFAPVSTAISWIPLVRDIPASIKYRSAVGNSPAFEGLNRIVKGIVTTGQFFAGKKEWHQVLWDVARATEMQFGIPATNVIRDIMRVYDSITR